MTGFLLKEFYLSKRSLLFVLALTLCYAFLFFPSSPYLYVILGPVLFGIIAVKSLIFDNECKWDRSALVAPVTRDYFIKMKFLSLMVFAAFGMLASLTGAGITALVFGLPEGLSAPLLILSMVAGWSYSVFCGSMAIPLAYRFGTREMWIINMGVYAVPTSIVYPIWIFADISLSGSAQAFLLGVSPLFALAFAFVMYKITCAIYRRKDI